MKKILLLAIIALSLNGCRYINPKHPHVDAKESKLLVVPEGLNEPSAISELEVPKAKTNNNLGVAQNTPPPEMPIRTRASQKGDVRIENVAGFAELSVKTETEYMWQAMNDLTIQNWTIKDTNKDTCQVTLYYTDSDAIEREEANFLKKLFTRDSFYTDYSGDYTLKCKKTGSLVRTTFAKSDGTKPKTFLGDNVMNALFEKFE